MRRSRQAQAEVWGGGGPERVDTAGGSGHCQKVRERARLCPLPRGPPADSWRGGPEFTSPRGFGKQALWWQAREHRRLQL